MLRESLNDTEMSIVQSYARLPWTHILIAITVEEKFCEKQKNSLATLNLIL